MKIYNKKAFASGVFSLVLGLALLAAMAATGNWRPKSVVLCVLCLLFGVGSVTRALSRDKAVRDLIDARDERNILVALRTKNLLHRAADRSVGAVRGLRFGYCLPPGGGGQAHLRRRVDRLRAAVVLLPGAGAGLLHPL